MTLYKERLFATDGTELKHGDKVIVTYKSGTKELCTVRSSKQGLRIMDSEDWMANLDWIAKLEVL